MDDVSSSTLEERLNEDGRASVQLVLASAYPKPKVIKIGIIKTKFILIIVKLAGNSSALHKGPRLRLIWSLNKAPETRTIVESWP